MRHKSIIDSLKRNNLKYEILEEKHFDNFSHYKFFVQGEKCSATWFYRTWKESGEETCSPYVLNNGSEDCFITDYFPGYFPKTIKKLINSLKGGSP